MPTLTEALKIIDAILFVVPTKKWPTCCPASCTNPADHKAIIMHASKGLEPDSHKRLSSLKKKFLNISRSDIVVVSGPSHAEETIVRDLTLITAASKNLQTAPIRSGLFSNHYFRLYTNTDVIGVMLVLLKILLLVLEPCMVGIWWQCQGSHHRSRRQKLPA